MASCYHYIYIYIYNGNNNIYIYIYKYIFTNLKNTLTLPYLQIAYLHTERINCVFFSLFLYKYTCRLSELTLFFFKTIVFVYSDTVQYLNKTFMFTFFTAQYTGAYFQVDTVRKKHFVCPIFL